MAASHALDTQVVELLGRNRLVSELLRAGLEVATPARDRGIDLIAYVDLKSHIDAFIARPIQMKAASTRHFSIYKKQAKIRDLILAFVWHLEDPGKAVTYGLTYAEAEHVADRMGWTKTDSWRNKGGYSTQQPSQRLVELLPQYKMTSTAWWEKVVGTTRRPTRR